VILSNHDFNKTPSKEEIVARLLHMEELHADIIKIAVMPENEEDVLRLLDASKEVYKKAQQPQLVISMGELGMLSRIACEKFGSSLTFGAVGETSAPGQIEVKSFKVLPKRFTQ